MPCHPSRRAFLTASAALLTLPVSTQLSGCKNSTAPEPVKKIFSDPKFELIDLALQHEFGAVVQYGNHAGVIACLHPNSESATFTEAIQEIINDEVYHAIQLTQIMTKNGVKPSIAVWPPQTADTTHAMLTQDIAAETGATKLYQQILSLDFDDQTKRIIENIMHAEELHHHTFSSLLPQQA